MTEHLGGPEHEEKLLDRHQRYLHLDEPEISQMFVIVLETGERTFFPSRRRAWTSHEKDSGALMDQCSDLGNVIPPAIGLPAGRPGHDLQIGLTRSLLRRSAHRPAGCATILLGPTRPTRQNGYNSISYGEGQSSQV